MGVGCRLGASQRKPEGIVSSHGEVVACLLDQGETVAAEDLFGDHPGVAAKIDGDRLGETGEIDDDQQFFLFMAADEGQDLRVV